MIIQSSEFKVSDDLFALKMKSNFVFKATALLEAISVMTEQNEECTKTQMVKEYSLWMEFIDNLPYILMTILGVSVFILNLQSSSWKWIFEGGYVLFGLTGMLWIIIFVCPYCHFYGTKSCPCGYGRYRPRCEWFETRPVSKNNSKSTFLSFFPCGSFLQSSESIPY